MLRRVNDAGDRGRRDGERDRDGRLGGDTERLGIGLQCTTHE